MMSIFIVTALASCSSENEIIDNGGIKGDERVEIKLKGGVSAVTKAVINPTLTEDLNVLFVRPTDGSETVENAAWSTTSQDNFLYAKIAAAGEHIISFYTDATRATPKKEYYNNDESTNAYLVGFYTDDATPTITNGVVSFTITGKEDIMATTALQGNKTTQFGTFTFEHKLSQLIFNVKAENANEDTEMASLYGKITKIEVLNQPTALKLTLGKTPTLAPQDGHTPSSLEIVASVDIKGGNAVPFGDPLLVYADDKIGSESNPIKLKITTDQFPNGIEADVTLTTTGLANSQTHSIELSFSKTEVNAKATIGEWTESGNNGSGTIHK